MDEFDRVIRDIQQKTADDVLRWRAVPTPKVRELGVYAPRLISAHRAEYRLGKEKYEILFLERATDPVEDLNDEASERTVLEAYVLGGEGEIVLRLYSGVVETKDLIRLASLIEGHNEQVKEFFDAFERANAAVPAAS
jgi:hypothetical protein